MQKILLSGLSLMVLACCSVTRAEDVPSQGPRTGERPHFEQIRKQMLEKFDTNKDGKLDETEREAAKAELGKRRGERGQLGGDRRGSDRRGDFLKKFDTNSDGKLDPQEREAAKEAMQKFRKQGGNRPGAKPTLTK